MKVAIVFAFLFALLAAVLAVPQKAVGAEKCTWGPSYWCASKENAVACDAVKHCEEKVWKQTS